MSMWHGSLGTNQAGEIGCEWAAVGGNGRSKRNSTTVHFHCSSPIRELRTWYLGESTWWDPPALSFASWMLPVLINAKHCSWCAWIVEALVDMWSPHVGFVNLDEGKLTSEKSLLGGKTKKKLEVENPLYGDSLFSSARLSVVFRCEWRKLRRRKSFWERFYKTKHDN